MVPKTALKRKTCIQNSSYAVSAKVEFLFYKLLFGSKVLLYYFRIHKKTIPKSSSSLKQPILRENFNRVKILGMLFTCDCAPVPKGPNNYVSTSEQYQ